MKKKIRQSKLISIVFVTISTRIFLLTIIVLLPTCLFVSYYHGKYVNFVAMGFDYEEKLKFFDNEIKNWEKNTSMYYLSDGDQSGMVIMNIHSCI